MVSELSRGVVLAVLGGLAVAFLTGRFDKWDAINSVPELPSDFGPEPESQLDAPVPGTRTTERELDDPVAFHGFEIEREEADLFRGTTRSTTSSGGSSSTAAGGLSSEFHTFA